jgi:hypothetical protein
MQETINIEEGNKLIAEFLGAVCDRGFIFFTEHPFCCYSYELFYHKSWDWLMLVVERIFKIKSIYFVTFGMQDDEKNYMVRFLGHGLHQAATLIESTWLAVVDFIKMNKNAENET